MANKITLPKILEALSNAVQKIDTLTANITKLASKDDLTQELETATKADGVLGQHITDKIDTLTADTGELHKTYVAVSDPDQGLIKTMNDHFSELMGY